MKKCSVLKTMILEMFGSNRAFLRAHPDLGLTECRLSRLVTGSCVPRREEAVELSGILNVNADRLLAHCRKPKQHVFVGGA
jgi:hypothetical protein